ncbi:MAG: flagellum-specific ATP synthase [Paracoccaceae bacterium]|jgi:flagellum-specific ATP synthase
MQNETDGLLAEIKSMQISRPVGRVVGVQGGLIEIQGLTNVASTGDLIAVHRKNGLRLMGEISRIDPKLVYMLPESAPVGVALADRATFHQTPEFAPSAHWIGRVIDPFGRPLDGKPLLRGPHSQNLMAAPAAAAERKSMGGKLATGLALLNTILPIVEGQRVGLFAGSGVGKSQLLATLAQNMQADVVVIALIGERGREVNDFVDRVMGAAGMKRAVVIAATSDQSALTRRRCAWSAMTVAEHFRNAGQNVLFLADSITRFAEAHREISVTAGEAPVLRGFPPSITPLITGLCERAGPGAGNQGSITAVFSVLVAGSDMDEPIADILRGVLDGHIILNRNIAERGRYPAIDVGKSVSRSLPLAASDSENAMISEARKLLGCYEKSEIMINAGLYTQGADPDLDRAVKVWPELDSFFARSDKEGISHSFDRLGLILRRAAAPTDRRKENPVSLG